MQRGENGGAAKSAYEPLCAKLIGWGAPVPPLKDEAPCRGFEGLVGRGRKAMVPYLKI